MNKIISISFFLLIFYTHAQEDTLVYSDEYTTETLEDTNIVESVFESSRIINGHSTYTLRKGILDFRVEHKFGDIGGVNGGVQTMYGLDNSMDIRLGLEYGLTDKLMIGVGRSKGTGAPYRSLLDGFVKFRLLDQQKKGSPVSLALLGTTTYTYMKASNDLTQVNAFPNWQHRFGYCLQLVMARKIIDKVTIALSPTWVHRNYVASNDQNDLLALGGAVRFPINSKAGIIFEYFQSFPKNGLRSQYTSSSSVSYDWVTFGHTFNVFLTNSSGFGEVQFIPYTTEVWNKGQFRIGFCIGRKFEKG